MVYAERLPRVIALVACLANLGSDAGAFAQTSAFDATKTGAASRLGSGLDSGLDSGLGEEVTSPVLKRIVDLALPTNERAQSAGASAATFRSLATVRAKGIELAGLYAIDVASPAPKAPAPAVASDGHTDSGGPAKFNQPLSQKRPEALQAYLVKKGVAADRLSARGDGEADPIASNATIAGRAENRMRRAWPEALSAAPVRS